MGKTMGRPRKPKAEIRAPGISIRLTESELMAVSDAAKRAGLGRSKFARKALLYVASNGIRIT